MNVRRMKIVKVWDERQQYGVQCGTCGNEFVHTLPRWIAICPRCARRRPIDDMKEEYLKEKKRQEVGD